MLSQTIWIVEDDLSMQAVYQDILGQKYQLVFMPGLEALAEWQERSTPPALMLLDLILGDGRLHESVDKFAAMLAKTPFLIVTNFDDANAMRITMTLGARDYISKPFGRNELQVKVELVLQSGRHSQDNGLCLDLKTMTLNVGRQKSQELTAKEFRILNLFLEQADDHLTRDQLFQMIWQRTSVCNKTLDVHLSNIRRKIRPLGYVINTSHQGYRLLPATRGEM